MCSIGYEHDELNVAVGALTRAEGITDHYWPWTVFLDASSHLYKRVCPSVGLSVRVRLRVRPVGQSVSLSPGKPCHSWRRVYQRLKISLDWIRRFLPDEDDFEGAGNFCRNPGNVAKAPFCLVKDERSGEGSRASSARMVCVCVFEGDLFASVRS